MVEHAGLTEVSAVEKDKARRVMAARDAADFLLDTEGFQNGVTLNRRELDRARDFAELATSPDLELITVLAGLTQAVASLAVLRGTEPPFARELEAAQGVLDRLAPGLPTEVQPRLITG